MSEGDEEKEFTGASSKSAFSHFVSIGKMGSRLPNLAPHVALYMRALHSTSDTQRNTSKTEKKQFVTNDARSQLFEDTQGRYFTKWSYFTSAYHCLRPDAYDSAQPTHQNHHRLHRKKRVRHKETMSRTDRLIT